MNAYLSRFKAGLLRVRRVSARPSGLISAVQQFTPAASALCGSQQDGENEITYDRTILPSCSYVNEKHTASINLNNFGD